MFAKDISELGFTDQSLHKIDTGDHPPVRSAPYRQHPVKRAEIERQTGEMLKHGIIEECTSPWHSPVVLVPKPDKKSFRFCIDYRKINKITVPQHFAMPRLDDAIDTVAQSRAEIFSVLDLMSGYFQVGMDPESKDKTAFVTHEGIFRFCRLPQGLINSPSSFQLLMTKVLKGLNWRYVLVYVDDILVFSQTFDQHLTHITAVFQRLRSAKLTLNPVKCQFATTRVQYLGHILSKNGIEIDKAKTEAVQTFPTPKSAKDVRSFLGLCNYYRKFVKNFRKSNPGLHWPLTISLPRRHVALSVQSDCSL